MLLSPCVQVHKDPSQLLELYQQWARCQIFFIFVCRSTKTLASCWNCGEVLNFFRLCVQVHKTLTSCWRFTDTWTRCLIVLLRVCRYVDEVSYTVTLFLCAHIDPSQLLELYSTWVSCLISFFLCRFTKTPASCWSCTNTWARCRMCGAWWSGQTGSRPQISTNRGLEGND